MSTKNMFVGEVVTRFFFGEIYKFKYLGDGEWSLESGSRPIPWAIRMEFFG